MRKFLVVAVMAVAATVLVRTASYAVQATVRCPATAQARRHFLGRVMLDAGTTPVGAYSITVTYDPAVVTIASVAGGETAEFAGTPTTDPASFTTGTTNISAFQSSSLKGPSGVVSAARVTFNVVAKASTATSVGLTVRNLFDTSSSPISTTERGCRVRVTAAKTQPRRPRSQPARGHHRPA